MIVTFASALSLLATAETSIAPDGRLDSPEWIRKPTGKDIVRVFPKELSIFPVDVTVKIRCTIGSDGSFNNCSVVEEPAPNQGFGQAALKLAPVFRVAPTCCGGRSVEGTYVIFPIRFTAS